MAGIWIRWRTLRGTWTLSSPQRFSPATTTLSTANGAWKAWWAGRPLRWCVSPGGRQGAEKANDRSRRLALAAETTSWPLLWLTSCRRSCRRRPARRRPTTWFPRAKRRRRVRAAACTLSLLVRYSARSVPCLRRRATDACRRGRLLSGRSPLSPPVCRIVGCTTTREGWSQYNNRTRCVGAARTGHGGGGGGWERVSFWGCVGTVRLASQLSRNASQTLQRPPASSRDHAAGLSDGAALLPGAFWGRMRALNTPFFGKPCRPATPRRFTRGRTTLYARRCRGRWRARDRTKTSLCIRRRLSADTPLLRNAASHTR